MNTPRFASNSGTDTLRNVPRLDPSSADVVALFEGQRSVLELITFGNSPATSLSELLRVIETQSPEMQCAIHRLDENGLQLWNVAAPSLPDEMIQAFNGGSIGPQSHSSGTAAFRQEPVFVEDMKTDALWKDHSEKVLIHGFHASWALPIFDSKHQILGTFSAFYRNPMLPTAQHRKLAEMAIHIAAIAIGKQKEETALRRSEARLAAAQAQALIGSWELDLVEQKATWSAELYRLLGRDPKKGPAVMPEFLEYVHLKDRAGLAQAFASAVESGDANYFEFRGNPELNNFKTFEAISQNFKNDTGKVIAMIGTIQDITVRRKNEASLREKERRLSEAQSIGRIGDWRYNILTGTIEWSDVLYELFERDPKAGPPGFAENMAYYFPEDSQRLQNLVARAVEHGEKYECDLHVQLQSGKIVWHHGIGQVDCDDSGSVVALYGTAQDITERKIHEATVQKSEDQLRALLSRLQRVQEEERTRVSREIHDELGQLLTGLKMDVRWIERKLSELPGSRIVNAIMDRAVGASELTDTTISTVQKIAAELRPGALDQLGLAAALSQRARRFEARTDITSKLMIEESGAPLPLGVSEELFYICQEALTNVTRHSQATNVEILLHTDATKAVLEIIDNGIGMSAAKMSESSSLGLLGMRERARQIGGTIEILQSEPHGTRVVATIPL